MLLAQPFEPLKERKLPFFARCGIISRTRQALFDLKNKTHYLNQRKFQPVMMPESQYLWPPQQVPQPWVCYNCVNPCLIQPPPPLPMQQPYSICFHFTSFPHSDDSSTAESTAYNSHSSSVYKYIESDDEEDELQELNRIPRQARPFTLDRSHSEMIPSRPRPPVNRWNSANIYYDYNN